MKKSGKALFVVSVIVLLFFAGCGAKDKGKEASGSQEGTELLVGAAASLQNSLEELQAVYNEKYPDVKLTFTFAGSGSIQQQIEQGAPVDVFISAAEKQMDALSEQDLILEDTRSDILQNKVVLIVPKDSKAGITGFEDIAKADSIALGDPESVPAGTYAEEIFTNLNLLETVQDKANYAKDVTEVLTWVSTSNADAGVVYATDAKSSGDVTVVAEAPEGSCSKVIYPAAVVKDTKAEATAREFVEFLSSEEAQEVFKEYGFSSVDE